MEFQYQTLKNLSEKLLKSRKLISRKGLDSLDRALVDYAGDILEEAITLANMSDRAKISDAHIEHAIAVIVKRR